MQLHAVSGRRGRVGCVVPIGRGTEGGKVKKYLSRRYSCTRQVEETTLDRGDEAADGWPLCRGSRGWGS